MKPTRLLEKADQYSDCDKFTIYVPLNLECLRFKLNIRFVDVDGRCEEPSGSPEADSRTRASTVQ